MFRKYLVFVWVINFLIPCTAQEIKFGVITDVHLGYLTDVHKRLPIFIDAANEAEVDFIIELGDFTLFMNDEISGSLMDIWNSFNGPEYKVLGNHDMDNNTKQEAVNYLGTESNYYTFDMHGFHFIVMDDNHIRLEDGSFVDYDNGNVYNGEDRDWFGDEQLLWLTEDLANTDQATVVFRHAGIHGKQQNALESIISNANSNPVKKKVILALNGHGHDDKEEIIDDVPYVEIPSASYIWNNHQAEPYTRVQFAIVTINTTNGTIVINGRSEDVEYQEGLPTHDPVITDKSYTFFPIGIKSSFSPSATECSPIVSFTNASSESATIFSWNFGDGQASTEESPTHIYTKPGTYQVLLTISDGTTGNVSVENITVNFSENPSVTEGSVNESGTVNLSASVSDGGTISWYDVADGGTVLGTGTSFTTPELSETTTFFAENVTGSETENCTSERVAVEATVIPVGVEEASTKNGITIWPNPSNGVVNIRIDNNIENLSIKVYNMSSQCVKTEKYDNTEDISLDLNELSQGVYVMELIGNDGLLGIKEISIL